MTSAVMAMPTNPLNANSASIKNTDAPIETFNAIGNDSLKPERSVEWETGFDSRLFGNRIQFDVTYYSKITHDALIGAVIAPSLGSGATSQRANLGSVKNAGVELTLGGQLFESRNFEMDFHVTSSLNANKVVSLGTTPPQIGVSNWTVAGYPIGGIWAKAITGYSDKNGDGILTVDEVTIVTDTLFDEAIDPLTTQAFSRKPEEREAKEIAASRAAVVDELAYFTKAMRGDFLAGPLSAADFTFYPYISYLPRCELKLPDLDADGMLTPELRAWKSRVERLPFFDKTIPPHWKS